MIIYLVRHGQTEWNNDGRYQGSIDIELDSVGREQAMYLGKRLSNYNIEQVYTSNLKRALETGEIINKYINSEILIDDKLQEINLGEWEGKKWEDIKIEYKDYLVDWFKDMVGYPAPGGESYIDLKNRSLKAIENIVAGAYKSVAVVSHGAVIKTLLCSFLSLGLEHRGKFEIDNGSISVVEYNPKKGTFKVLSINDVSHFIYQAV